VTVSIPYRRLAGVVLAASAFLLPAQAGAQAPTPQELARVSPSGSYLAARHAGAQRDAAAAAAYYRAALRNDPRNPELLSRAFLSFVFDGDMEEGIKLADRLLQVDRNDRTARLVIGVRALKQKQYQIARQNLAQSVGGPITDLAAALLAAWTQANATEAKTAIEAIDRLSGPEWYAIFKDLHAGMILDAAGNKREAGRRLERAYKLDQTALRVTEAYGRWASRNKPKAEALKIFEDFEKVLPRHPLIAQETKQLKTGETLPPLADNPQAGAAEALYGLGASLGRRGDDLGLVYLQLALYLAPQHGLALLSLADLYESQKNPELAIKLYERVPKDSPLRRNADIQIAVNFESLAQTQETNATALATQNKKDEADKLRADSKKNLDEAKKRLDKLIAENPNDLDAILALGTVERTRKQYAECAQTYSKGIATLEKAEKAHWQIFYFRGICFERDKQWPNAEADFKKSLELFPDQPQVLNYLGYSWIDQGVNLEEGMKMIRRAVEQKPDDGYIVDSLGWAYYRIGNYEEATKHLERAVELRPEDPTINDHLGDVYWKVGRQLEAKFQWSHAKDLKPEPEELVKIEEKLRFGLRDETSAAEAERAKKAGNGG
jgi:tetratricopeptide (TPR) repeat protein